MSIFNTDHLPKFIKADDDSDLVTFTLFDGESNNSIDEYTEWDVTEYVELLLQEESELKSIIDDNLLPKHVRGMARHNYRKVVQERRQFCPDENLKTVVTIEFSIKNK